MNLNKQVFGERPAHGTFAKFLFPLLAAGFIVYLGMFAHNVSNTRNGMRVMVRQVGGVMVAVTKPATLSDPEAAGDIADAEEAASKKMLALQK